MAAFQSPSEVMDNSPKYDIALWETHESDDDCSFIIRTDNGRAFYCEISPSQFHRPPWLKNNTSNASTYYVQAKK
ncbi:hypothetical protein E5D57_013235 [Metarhizium anisopliae]|nr:hypothetical protein E5D57_013235 [Metarhizium anisopliae]